MNRVIRVIEENGEKFMSQSDLNDILYELRDVSGNTPISKAIKMVQVMINKPTKERNDARTKT